MTGVTAQKPLGVRLNNPLNIRPGSPWEGLGVPDEVSGFCNFKSPVFGFRAAFRNLMTYADGHGINSIKGIVSRWAPPGDNNDTGGYINAVCKRTGYGPDQVLDLKTWNVSANVVRAMTVQEQGDFAPYFTVAQMSEGAFRAGIADAPAPLAKRVSGVVAGTVAAGGGAATTALAVAQPAIMASGSMKLIIAFAVVTAIAGIIAAIVHAKPKAQG